MNHKIRELNIEFILRLYKKYLTDIEKVRKYQKKLYYLYTSRFEKYIVYRSLQDVMKRIMGLGITNRLRPQLDDVEAEITYLLIREFKPENIVEISPCGGWSTSWILNAIRDNNFGKLYSYDLIDDSVKIIPSDLSKDKWIFIKGDIKKNINRLPQIIDYIFIDSDHSTDFAHWYIKNIFPKLKIGTPISVHDVFHKSNPSSFDGEGGVIIDWLEQKGIKYFTASKRRDKKIYDKIMLVKRELGTEKRVHYSQVNPMIFFLIDN